MTRQAEPFKFQDLGLYINYNLIFMNTIQYVGEGSEEFQDFLNLNIMITFLYDWMLGWFVSCVSGTLSMPFGTVLALTFDEPIY